MHGQGDLIAAVQAVRAAVGVLPACGAIRLRADGAIFVNGLDGGQHVGDLLGRGLEGNRSGSTSADFPERTGGVDPANKNLTQRRTKVYL